MYGHAVGILKGDNADFKIMTVNLRLENIGLFPSTHHLDAATLLPVRAWENRSRPLDECSITAEELGLWALNLDVDVMLVQEVPRTKDMLNWCERVKNTGSFLSFEYDRKLHDAHHLVVFSKWTFEASEFVSTPMHEYMDLMRASKRFHDSRTNLSSSKLVKDDKVLIINTAMYQPNSRSYSVDNPAKTKEIIEGKFVDISESETDFFDGEVAIVVNTNNIAGRETVELKLVLGKRECEEVRVRRDQIMKINKETPASIAGGYATSTGALLEKEGWIVLQQFPNSPNHPFRQCFFGKVRELNIDIIGAFNFNSQSNTVDVLEKAVKRAQESYFQEMFMPNDNDRLIIYAGEFGNAEEAKSNTHLKSSNILAAYEDKEMWKWKRETLQTPSITNHNFAQIENIEGYIKYSNEKKRLQPNGVTFIAGEVSEFFPPPIDVDDTPPMDTSWTSYRGEGGGEGATVSAPADFEFPIPVREDHVFEFPGIEGYFRANAVRATSPRQDLTSSIKYQGGAKIRCTEYLERRFSDSITALTARFVLDRPKMRKTYPDNNPFDPYESQISNYENYLKKMKTAFESKSNGRLIGSRGLEEELRSENKRWWLALVSPREKASGLKWKDVGLEIPAGCVELQHPDLQYALGQFIWEPLQQRAPSGTQGKTAFDQKDWDSFGINDLRANQVVKVGLRYMQPIVDKTLKYLETNPDGLLANIDSWDYWNLTVSFGQTLLELRDKMKKKLGIFQNKDDDQRFHAMLSFYKDLGKYSNSNPVLNPSLNPVEPEMTIWQHRDFIREKFQLEEEDAGFIMKFMEFSLDSSTDLFTGQHAYEEKFRGAILKYLFNSSDQNAKKEMEEAEANLRENEVPFPVSKFFRLWMTWADYLVNEANFASGKYWKNIDKDDFYLQRSKIFSRRWKRKESYDSIRYKRWLENKANFQYTIDHNDLTVLGTSENNKVIKVDWEGVKKHLLPRMVGRLTDDVILIVRSRVNTLYYIPYDIYDDNDKIRPWAEEPKGWRNPVTWLDFLREEKVESIDYVKIAAAFDFFEEKLDRHLFPSAHGASEETPAPSTVLPPEPTVSPTAMLTASTPRANKRDFIDDQLQGQSFWPRRMSYQFPDPLFSTKSDAMVTESVAAQKPTPGASSQKLTVSPSPTASEETPPETPPPRAPSTVLLPLEPTVVSSLSPTASEETPPPRAPSTVLPPEPTVSPTAMLTASTPTVATPITPSTTPRRNTSSKAASSARKERERVNELLARAEMVQAHFTANKRHTDS